MRRVHWAFLAAGVVAAGSGAWALAEAGALGAGVALRVGTGAVVGFVLAFVLPSLWPAGIAVSAFEQAVRAKPPAPPPAPASLRRVERDVVLATGRAGSSDLYHTLCPMLRELAAHRLRSAHGVELDAQPAQARALLGYELWDLVRQDRPAPEDRNAPGLPMKDLARAGERLESL